MTTVDQHNELINRAKQRKDGVYQYRGFYYAVKDNCFVAYADHDGTIYRPVYSFQTQIGKCKTWERKETLRKYLKMLK